MTAKPRTAIAEITPGQPPAGHLARSRPAS